MSLSGPSPCSTARAQPPHVTARTQLPSFTVGTQLSLCHCWDPLITAGTQPFSPCHCQDPAPPMSLPGPSPPMSLPGPSPPMSLPGTQPPSITAGTQLGFPFPWEGAPSPEFLHGPEETPGVAGVGAQGRPLLPWRLSLTGHISDADPAWGLHSRSHEPPKTPLSGLVIWPVVVQRPEAARRIFYDGIMERIPNTAFRGLRQHPRTQLLYALLAAVCFAVTRSLLLTCLVPAGLLGLRYYYSRKVILAYLECALHTDMADIEQYYMKPPGSCFWVAVLDGNVVGIVAARGHEEDNTVELLRMSVDSRFRGKGIAKALGRKVLEFALLHNYSAVVLGTTAVKVAAHKLYESLGFRHMGASDRYVLPGMTHSLAERLFFQVRYHRYRLQLREE
ncbi:PREDICTED: N-acetylaspartate synthetase [Elephantulus edwardii]|uniref:N-acetylaspartate synthetase n=1 Tax=Elephantulus edwardii TaxID=28737 RepID=UPI0003F0673E|nr:PREDICTED: N-acetylaspartate synthetase [Elephantulus edwardii]